MNIFYLPEISAPEVILNEEESGHAVKVLRLKENDPVILVNGKGNLYEAVIIESNSKKCRVRINQVRQEFEKRNYRLHMAVAPTKNHDRMEWFLEKATEIGLDEFTPLVCHHSERKQIQMNRLEKIAVAAIKQSLKAYLPVIHEAAPFITFVSQPFEGKKFIAHCHPGEKPHLKNRIALNENILILIGPEGDFSPEEVSHARHSGFEEISLGNFRLRTETAALVACHTVALCNTPDLSVSSRMEIH